MEEINRENCKQMWNKTKQNKFEDTSTEDTSRGPASKGVKALGEAKTLQEVVEAKRN